MKNPFPVSLFHPTGYTHKRIPCKNDQRVSWHGCTCSRAHGNQQWVGGVSEFASSAALNQIQCFLDLNQDELQTRELHVNIRTSKYIYIYIYIYIHTYINIYIYIYIYSTLNMNMRTRILMNFRLPAGSFSFARRTT